MEILATPFYLEVNKSKNLIKKLNSYILFLNIFIGCSYDLLTLVILIVNDGKV